jgi:hypothetical protein
LHETTELARLVDQFEVDETFDHRGEAEDMDSQSESDAEEPDASMRDALREAAPHVFAAPSRGAAARLASAR